MDEAVTMRNRDGSAEAKKGPYATTENADGEPDRTQGEVSDNSRDFDHAKRVSEVAAEANNKPSNLSMTKLARLHEEHDDSMKRMSDMTFGLVRSKEELDNEPNLLQGMYQPLDATKREIRVLELEPAATMYDPMCCTFRTIALNPSSGSGPCVRYDALSYVWGDPSRTRMIQLNGRLCGVTQNLFEAIFMLRSKLHDTTTLLWVDALCINQENMRERSQQVSLMRDIYTCADEVPIWLGMGFPSLEPLVARYNRLVDEDKIAGPLGEDLEDSRGVGEINPLDKSDGTYDGLAYLVNRPWWSRLWVVQEAYLAKSPIFHFVDRHQLCTLHYDSLLGVMGRVALWCSRQGPVYELLLNDPFATQTVRQLTSITIVFKPQAVHKMLSGHVTLSQSLKTLDRINGHCDVTDLRDRVYALLALLPPDLGIIPDYTATVETVYEDFGYRMMKWAKSLEILIQSLPLPGESHSEHVPSWSPKFGKPHDEPYASASHGSTCVIDRHRPGILTINAYLHDEVYGCAPLARDILRGKYKATDQGGHKLIARSWRSFAETAVASMSTPKQTRPAFWRSLIRDEGKCMGCDEPGCPLHPLPSNMTAVAFDNWSEDSGTIHAEKPVDRRLMMALIASLCGRNFFVTRQGRYGTVKSHFDGTAPRFGDKIAILAGCPYPFILQREAGAEHTYRLVGPCYCNGIMYGEAIREAALKRTGNAEDVDAVFEQIQLH